MNDLRLIIGKTIEVSGGRLIKVESVLTGALETFVLLRWLDTNEVFCEYPDKIHELLRK